MKQSFSYVIKLSFFMLMVAYSSLSLAKPLRETQQEVEAFMHHIGVDSYLEEQVEVLWARYQVEGAPKKRFSVKNHYKIYILTHDEMKRLKSEACLSYFTHHEIVQINHAFYQSKNSAEFKSFLKTPLGQKLIYNQPKLKKRCAINVSQLANSII